MACMHLFCFAEISCKMPYESRFGILRHHFPLELAIQPQLVNLSKKNIIAGMLRTYPQWIDQEFFVAVRVGRIVTTLGFTSTRDRKVPHWTPSASDCTRRVQASFSDALVAVHGPSTCYRMGQVVRHVSTRAATVISPSCPHLGFNADALNSSCAGWVSTFISGLTLLFAWKTAVMSGTFTSSWLRVH